MRKINGSRKADVLGGFSTGVEIFARGGDDWIVDTFRQGQRSTNDIFHGQNGDDLIFTLGGKDRIFGDTGDDTVLAMNKDAFSFDGGDGRDVLKLVAQVNDTPSILKAGGEIVGVTFGEHVIKLENVERVKVIYADEWPF